MSRYVRIRPAYVFLVGALLTVLTLFTAACDDDGPRPEGGGPSTSVSASSAASSSAAAAPSSESSSPAPRDPYFPEVGDGGYDVTHYALDIAYDPGTHRLSGTAGITARATRGLASFSLDLAGLDVESVTVGGEAAPWERSGRKLTVRPARGRAPRQGATFRTTVRYAGRPRTITDADGSKEGWLPTADGALALGEPVGSMAWFPGDDRPSDKATYDIEITVPKGLQAVSNGELTARRAVDGGTRTAYRWHVGEPMASYLALAAIGKYAIRNTTYATNTTNATNPIDTTNATHPFGTVPFGTAPFRTVPSGTAPFRTVPSGTGVFGTGRALPLLTAVDPTQARASRAALAQVPGILAWEERRFGPYPFSSAGVVVDRPGDAGYALETQNRPFFPGAPSTSFLVHELAHQWYGDSVTPRTWRDMWLNEGFATYAEWLWSEDHGGDSAQKTFDALYHGTYYPTPGENAAVWSFPPADPPDAAGVSGVPVYQRGAMVLHKIRRTVGDAAFTRILKGWAATHRHGNADTADFTAYVERQAPGRDFGEIWKDWLYGKGKPPRP